MTPDMIEEKQAPNRRPSSWSAALSQLPGFPETEKPKLPELKVAAAREVSPVTPEDAAEEEELEE